MSGAELDFLKDVREYFKKIFFLLNKADYLSEKDLQESIDFSKDVLKTVMSTDMKIFPVSAKLAREGKICGSEDTLKKSRLLEFSDVLNRFFMEEKGKVLIQSVANNLLRIISRATFELELKTLSTPLDELKTKIAKFEGKKWEMMREKQDFEILLDGETKNMHRDVIDEDLTAFRREMVTKVSANLEKTYNTRSDMSLKELQKHLEDQIINEVKQAFSVWRGIEDEKLAATFEALCNRFITKIDETVDSLLTFSAELFGVPFDVVKAEAIWSTKSGFYYKFKDQPVGIELMASSLTLLLPKFIGEKMILKKMKVYLYKAIDMQCGRMGNNFALRLDKSKLDFRWKMLQRIEETEKSIENAIQKDVGQRQQGTAVVDERQQALADTSASMQCIHDCLLGITNAAQQ